MTRDRRISIPILLSCWVTLVIPGLVQRARAGCNIIPPAVTTFRGALGSLDRPFARPGDWVKIALDPVCAASSSGFVGPAADPVVTIVYTPPGVGQRNVIALASNCVGVDTATCAALPDVADATCVTVNGGRRPARSRDNRRELVYAFAFRTATISSSTPTTT